MSNEPIKLEDELVTELYETRLIFMVETDPQTNKYRQIILNNEEFKQVSDLLANIFRKKYNTKDNESFEVLEGEEIVTLPDSFKTYT